ncbi:MAG TPA: phosphate acyltransferase PlsX [Gemmatimonadaceae bacterium]|nr:phosphate acyltransferase PlsX [Gemmatimonadaceae bacterium]
MARIALDAMGGDFAPRAPVAGALQALRASDGDLAIQLVGRTTAITTELDSLLKGEMAADAKHRDRIEIVEAPEVIEMSDKPSAVIRGKPNNSMSAGLKLQLESRSDAFVSAGNTGAQMAASAMLLKLHPGLTRPAIATAFPTRRQPVVVLDAGANVDCSARELLQFAWLGAVYAESVLGRANPAVGLLSIGEEAEKGNAVVKEANAVFASAGFNFVGNVEGRDLPAGECARGPIDVVVCDGFVGNVVLKFYEGVMPMVLEVLQQNGIDRAQLKDVIRTFDSSEYGGAPLLGVKGISMICHGNSSPRAIANAIKAAARAAGSGMNAQIGERLAALANGSSASGAAA